MTVGCVVLCGGRLHAASIYTASPVNNTICSESHRFWVVVEISEYGEIWLSSSCRDDRRVAPTWTYRSICVHRNLAFGIRRRSTPGPDWMHNTGVDDNGHRQIPAQVHQNSAGSVWIASEGAACPADVLPPDGMLRLLILAPNAREPDRTLLGGSPRMRNELG